MTNEELVELYQQGDKQALDSLIEQNKGIIYKLVNRFYVEKTNSIDREDLEQEGTIGLIIAARKYDFNNEKKAKFITYAIHWIYSKINRYINQRNTNDETSLNIHIGEDEENELIDTIKDIDYSYENVEEKIYMKELRQEIEEVMKEYNTLEEREILKLRHGWDSNNIMALSDIGELLNINVGRVRTIEDRAYRKLRRTKWGANKAKEFYVMKREESVCSIDKTIDTMSFADKYLCI
ncbi:MULTISPECIES: sigma-70 family RNA polymerase sigma factor [Clostridium]|uniref:RNA polymerase, sigma 32 subunit, RpoH n=1 Tax=Clostridium botulinum D str. 1873 TaxID=592027 RepID=A0A9P2G6B4_CLOBO|nr:MULTISPECIES: sigma-70 family RNA polymerase sigma factor [Clostridium]EES90782.1 RNA polymerase, sigma 32 subunit, RpoH [Clostridium botulinum D str. 1873]MBO3441610.1 sigma-70 family RNA polymerase sigma factor [Clostridium haemolyticum]QPW54894.1 sigma-70 family RNA polymerase sigma factor [Clostridium botulinum]